MSVSSASYSPYINATTSGSPNQPGLYEYLAELVSKRVATMKYIRRAHEGNTHWFNTILLSKESLTDMYPNSKMARRLVYFIFGENCKLIFICRSYNFYALGLSLGAILDITNPIDYIKSLSQLMSEFERHSNDDSKQKMVGKKKQ
jgi:hypothetical protein